MLNWLRNFLHPSVESWRVQVEFVHRGENMTTVAIVNLAREDRKIKSGKLKRMLAVQLLRQRGIIAGKLQIISVERIK